MHLARARQAAQGSSSPHCTWQSKAGKAEMPIHCYKCESCGEIIKVVSLESADVYPHECCKAAGRVGMAWRYVAAENKYATGESGVEVSR